jgi:hypothetical protein
MAERPDQIHNARFVDSYGPKFRIDVNNPQMGLSGPNVYKFYGVTDNNDVNLVGLSEDGTYKIHNDRVIEIIAGQKTNPGNIDIVIASLNGDITITAMSNGVVRIKGKNIMIEADEDVDIKAGRNVNVNSGSGRILLKGNKIDKDALTGNMIENNFGKLVFEGSKIGVDRVADLLKPQVPIIGDA